MSPEEVNKIIAEYMGFIIDENYQDKNPMGYILDNRTSKVVIPFYYRCLNSLIPVWEKLRNEDDIFEFAEIVPTKNSGYIRIVTNRDDYRSHRNTIQEAAARATAKIIKDIK